MGVWSQQVELTNFVAFQTVLAILHQAMQSTESVSSVLCTLYSALPDEEQQRLFETSHEICHSTVAVHYFAEAI